MRDVIDAAVADVTAGSPVAIDVDHGGALPLVRVDAAQVQRVIVNLVENAVKFSPPDEHVLVAAAARGGRVVVSVSDHGPGVPESDGRTSSGRSTAAAAATARLGLGLAIAQGLAVANGATVTLEPANGAGATLTVSIPAAPTPERRPR